MYGIFVNEDGGIHYAQAIVGSYKPLETRGRNMLSKLIGDRVAVIRTRRGKKPLVLGYVNIDSAERRSKDWLDKNRDKTLIPPGSKYDSDRPRWCYALSGAEKCDPYPLPEDAIRHGRSWCEF